MQLKEVQTFNFGVMDADLQHDPGQFTYILQLILNISTSNFEMLRMSCSMFMKL